MKRFRFALQAVLDQRQRIEDEKQMVVAVKKRAVDEAEAELRRLNEEFRVNADVLRIRHSKLDTEELRLTYAHLQFLDRCIVSQIKVVAERRVALDRARAELLVASKDRKAVEKLKERRREAHDTEAMRLEQNEIDDGNARRYGRSVQVGGSK
jgi:flagellar FliJ protein